MLQCRWLKCLWHTYSSRDWLFLAQDTAFFLPLVIVCHNPLCVRTRNTLNLFLEWRNPLKSGPTSNRKWSPFALHKLFVQRITSHRHKKINVDQLWSYQAQIMVESFVLISSNLVPCNGNTSIEQSLMILEMHIRRIWGIYQFAQAET